MSGGQGAENRTSHLLFSRKIIGKQHPLGGIQYAKYKLIPFHCSLVIVARTLLYLDLPFLIMKNVKA